MASPEQIEVLGEKRATWVDVIDKYVRVGQEVLLDGVWSEIEFSGWVATVFFGSSDAVLVLDNGEDWTVEDGEQSVRNSKLLPCTSVGQPKWLKRPEVWERRESGWFRQPVEPKVEGCHCENCSLYDSTLVDDPDRFKECDVLFVGEAPGWEEERDGLFFRGKAGRLLRAIVEQTGVGKFKCSYNNTCICYATDAPTIEDIKACKGRLSREIELSNPKLVVAIGGVALQALTDLTGITEHQGLLMDWEGRKLLPCFHSAAVLRRPDLFYTFAETVYKAALFLQGSESLDVQPKDFRVHVVRDDESFSKVKDILRGADMLYVDLETTDYNPYIDKIICVSVSYAVGGRASRECFVFPWPLSELSFSWLKNLLETKPCTGWNMFFDAQFLMQNGIIVKAAGDVMLKHYTLDETPMSQGLKPSARRYCNAPDWEEPLREYLPSKSTSFSVIPPEILYPYGGLDAGYTGVLDEIISARMDDNNRRVYNDILIPALNMFLHTCGVGLRVDVSRLEGLRAELQVKMKDLQKQLEEMSGILNFNPSSIRDARYLIHDVLGIGEKNGSTSRTALEDHKDVAGVSLLLQYRETRKLLGTYIDGLVDDLIEVGEDEEKVYVVHPNIRLNGTVTGRLSSADPNFFGQPEEKGGIKKLYEARHKGWGIGNGDGAQMEIRVLGALSNDRAMIEAFKSGVDFHGAARNRLYSKGFVKSNYTHQEVLDAKTAVFGPIYGRGAFSLAQQFYHSEIATIKAVGGEIKWPVWTSLPRQEQEQRVYEAQDHINKLWAPYPTALQWLKGNVERAMQDGELVSWYGRYRHWGLISDDTEESVRTEGRNFGVQSPSSDTNLLVMLSSYHAFPHFAYLPIFPVHDSVVFTYRLGEEKWLIPELKKHYERKAQELLHTDMKFEYEFSIGPNWGEQTPWRGGV